MYAIIRTGSKQYRVEPGDQLRIEKLDQNLGSTVEIKEVLAIGGEKTQFGDPLIKGAMVEAVIVRQDKAKKVWVFKKKRREGFRRLRGHRQPFTEIFVKAIVSPDGKRTEAETEARVIDPTVIKERRAQRLAAETSEKKGQKKTAATAKKVKAVKKVKKKATSTKGKKKVAKKKVASKGKKAAKKTSK